MGECGCGHNIEDRAVKLPSGDVLAYGVYPGCRDCSTGIGFGIRLYDTVEHCRKWMDIEPDEYGGNDGFGIGIEILDVDDIVEAVREAEEPGDLFRHQRPLSPELPERLGGGALEVVVRDITGVGLEDRHGLGIAELAEGLDRPFLERLPLPAEKPEEEGPHRGRARLLRQVPRAQGHHDADTRAGDHGPHWAVGLREVNLPALPEPHERRAGRRAHRGPRLH